jgi:hypothetical protein
MNEVTLKSRATLLGQVFAAKGLTLTRAEQLDIVAQLEGARDWHHARGKLSRIVPKKAAVKLASQPYNALQLEAAKVYCFGEFAHVTDQVSLADVGDTLLDFVICEVGNAGDDREDAARMMRVAAKDLLHVADALDGNASADIAPLVAGNALELEPAYVPRYGKPVPNYQATGADGVTKDWRLCLISDRFGEMNPGLGDNRPLQAIWAIDNAQAFQSLFSLCLDEMAFVVELNGQRGVLYEVEIETTESEAVHPAGERHCGVSEADRRIELQGKVSELALAFPHLEWAIGGPDGMWHGRLGVWAFCAATTPWTKEDARLLTDALYKMFY